MSLSRSSRLLWKCPTCGYNQTRAVFTRAALGHGLIALRQHFVGRGNGQSGGAFIWERRPLSHDELEHVGRALACACENLTARLRAPISAAAPEDVLADIADTAELEMICADWIKDGEDELARRKEIITAEFNRRGIYE